MVDFRKYGILPEKGRSYESIAYVLALVYGLCSKKLTKVLSKYGVSMAQYNVMMVVRFQAGEEGITQVDIGNHLIVTPGSIARLVEKLAVEKMVTVKQNKNNRRENLVKITDKGIALMEKIWPEHHGLVESMVNLIPKEKQAGFAQTLADWFNKLQKEK